MILFITDTGLPCGSGVFSVAANHESTAIICTKIKYRIVLTTIFNRIIYI